MVAEDWRNGLVGTWVAPNNSISKDVLCLACGGGQQSIAFALLEANVTVFDLSEAQLNRDREAAHFGVDIKILQGDIRDLSHLNEAAYRVYC
jgi:2-polyprenyl-3-methyl-5-hydroxy-6-metoxy-1,4-benzoquinol methylase